MSKWISEDDSGIFIKVYAIKGCRTTLSHVFS